MYSRQAYIYIYIYINIYIYIYIYVDMLEKKTITDKKYKRNSSNIHVVKMT